MSWLEGQSPPSYNGSVVVPLAEVLIYGWMHGGTTPENVIPILENGHKPWLTLSLKFVATNVQMCCLGVQLWVILGSKLTTSPNGDASGQGCPVALQLYLVVHTYSKVCRRVKGYLHPWNPRCHLITLDSTYVDEVMLDIRSQAGVSHVEIGHPWMLALLQQCLFGVQ